MNSILYETDEQRKHVHTGWSKVVAVDEVYWKCNHCGVTADSPVAPADDPKVAEEGSSTNDRANAEVSRKYTTVSSENITLTQASPSDSLSRMEKNDE